MQLFGLELGGEPLGLIVQHLSLEDRQVRAQLSPAGCAVDGYYHSLLHCWPETAHISFSSLALPLPQDGAGAHLPRRAPRVAGGAGR